MATTTAFGWETPDDTDLVKDGAAAIRTLGSSIDTSMAELKGGTTGQVLSKTSATDMDFTWITPTDLVAANPNLIINGNFTINQRGYVSAANLASGSYGFDRWKSNFTNTTLTYTTEPAGQSVTINSGGGLQQIVERANVPAGTYVLSFTGTATGRIYNSGEQPPSYAASPITFTADGLENVVVEFTASGATKTLGKVKLELASSPTAFCFAGGTIQGELAACQRYYQRVDLLNNLAEVGFGQMLNTTVFDFLLPLKTTLRAATSLFTSGGSVYDTTSASVYSGGTFSIGAGNVNGVVIRYTHGSSVFTTGRMGYVFGGSGFIAIEGEL
jgi:hypothetical protein